MNFCNYPWFSIEVLKSVVVPLKGQLVHAICVDFDDLWNRILFHHLSWPFQVFEPSAVVSQLSLEKKVVVRMHENKVYIESCVTVIYKSSLESKEPEHSLLGWASNSNRQSCPGMRLPLPLSQVCIKGHGMLWWPRSDTCSWKSERLHQNPTQWLFRSAPLSAVQLKRSAN